MKPNKYCRHTFLITMVIVMATLPLSLSAAEQSANDHRPDQAGELYLPSDDAMADLNTTLASARQRQKLALIILGANWCHDSRGLAARLQVEPLKSVVQDNYETLFVNVGNLSEGRDVIQSLGVPIYYATPTVLIIDPISGNLINQGNRHMWARADSISMEESVDYFQSVANTDLAEFAASLVYTDQQARLMADIDAFEQVQADRLSEAYIITGAMLEAEFDQSVWSEVGRFRNSVANDVDALRAQVAVRIANGETDIVLTYPSYPEWSWDSQADAEANP